MESFEGAPEAVDSEPEFIMMNPLLFALVGLMLIYGSVSVALGIVRDETESSGPANSHTKEPDKLEVKKDKKKKRRKRKKKETIQKKQRNVSFDESTNRVYRINQKLPANTIVTGLTAQQERDAICKEARKAKNDATAKSKAKAEARRRKLAVAKAKHDELVEKEQNQRCAKAFKKLEAAKRRKWAANVKKHKKLVSQLAKAGYNMGDAEEAVQHHVDVVGCVKHLLTKSGPPSNLAPLFCHMAELIPLIQKHQDDVARASAVEGGALPPPTPSFAGLAPHTPPARGQDDSTSLLSLLGLSEYVDTPSETKVPLLPIFTCHNSDSKPTGLSTDTAREGPAQSWSMSDQRDTAGIDLVKELLRKLQ